MVTSSLSSRARTVASVVLAYWVVSISMVFLNKVLMSNESLSIPAPLFITWFQCVATVGICYWVGVKGEEKRRANQPSFFTQFPMLSYDLQTAIKVLPLSIIQVGMMTFNNICLKFVEVSFYNVARSLTIVFNVVLSYFLLKQTVSHQVVLALAVVIGGFYVGVDGEINFSLLGTVSGVLSSLFVSLNATYTKKVLPFVDNDKSQLLFYNNMNAIFLFLPLILTFETDSLVLNSDKFFSLIFWGGLCLSGVFGFLIGLVTVMQIKATSPLTHNISGTAKACVQSLLGFMLWGNEATVKGVSGIFMTLGGSILYTYIRMKEEEKQNKEQVENQQKEGGEGGKGRQDEHQGAEEGNSSLFPKDAEMTAVETISTSTDVDFEQGSRSTQTMTSRSHHA